MSRVCRRCGDEHPSNMNRSFRRLLHDVQRNPMKYERRRLETYRREVSLVYDEAERRVRERR